MDFTAIIGLNIFKNIILYMLFLKNIDLFYLYTDSFSLILFL